MNEKIEKITSLSKEVILFQLLKKQEDYYISILDITKEENKKLKNLRPLEEINILHKRKKVFLTSISEIEKGAQPLKFYWQMKRDRSDEDSIKVTKTLLELDSLLKDILQLDMINQNIMEQYIKTLRSPPINM